MGKLILTHLQRATRDEDSDSSTEDFRPTIKNTFLHFKNPCDEAMPRHRTAPAPQPVHTFQELPVPEEPTTPTYESAQAETNGNASPYSNDVPRPASAAETPCKAESCSAKKPLITSWEIDARRLRGRDTRISTTLRPLLGGGPETTEVILTISPVLTSTKRGGSSFKAANSVGKMQLKCNNPVDRELLVCISIGNTTRCQKHNFASNPLMSFEGQCDFKAFIDSGSDRPEVTMNLQLLSPGDAEDNAVYTSTPERCATVVPALADPAIAAFSLSGKVASLSNDGYPRSPATTVPSESGDSSNGLPQTPEWVPRAPSEQGWTPPPQAPTAATSIFNVGDSTLFNFTLRRAEGVEVGLAINRDNDKDELVVERIIPGGAVESWNRQCFQGTFATKAVVPGDRIIGISGRCTIDGMLAACKQKTLLKIFVIRGSLSRCEIPEGWCPEEVPPEGQQDVGAAAEVVPTQDAFNSMPTMPAMQVVQAMPAMQTMPMVAVPFVTAQPFVYVPYAVPCVKHAIVDADGTSMAGGNEQTVGGLVPMITQVTPGGFYFAAAPEFCAQSQALCVPSPNPQEAAEGMQA